MKFLSRAILALALMAGLAPAFAQAPPPVPALPDTERRTTYSISATTCACAVGFQLYGDSTDYANWLTVFINGVQIAQPGNWTITSPSGSLATLPRPITDAVLTFNIAQTGTVQIVGARRPRRTSQFSESRGVAARDINQIISDLEAQTRELWDRQFRTVQAPPGETLNFLPVKASRANMNACFDTNGMLTSCISLSSGSFVAGSGVTFTGTGPTTISVATYSAGNGITFTGTNPTVISVTGSGSTTIQTSNYTIATTDCAKTVRLGTGTTGFFTATLPAAGGFTEGCTVTVQNGDGWTSRGKALSGFPTGFSNGQNILWPLQAGTVQIVNGAWVTIYRPGRAKLPTGQVNFFSNYSNTGADASNDCLSATISGATGPCQSAGHALYLACNEFDFTGTDQLQTQMWVNMAGNVTDQSPIHIACPSVPGGQGGAQLVLNGTGPNSTLNTLGGDAIFAGVNATLSVSNLTIGTNSGDCVRSDYGGEIFFGSGNTFSVCASAHLEARNAGRIYLQSSYTVNGNATIHYKISNGGVITTDPVNQSITVTMGQNLTLSDWVIASQGGVLDVPNVTYTLAGHTVTAIRISQGSGSNVYTGLGNAACLNTYFPGSVNGASDGTGSCL